MISLYVASLRYYVNRSVLVCSTLRIQVKASKTMSEEEATHVAAVVGDFCQALDGCLKHPAVVALHGEEGVDVVSVRVRTKRNELIVAPDAKCKIAVIHEPDWETHKKALAAKGTGAEEEVDDDWF
ncbi:MAG: hypothetical protein MHM6MM_000988 [Cercozoa sp. M6MM]